MNKITLIFGIIAYMFLINHILGQGFTELKSSEDVEIDDILISYTVVKKQTKKGNDLYRLTATITSRGYTDVDIFNNAKDYLIEDPKNHKSKSVIISTQFSPWSTLSKVYNTRVPEGEEPTMRVMVY